MLAYLRRWPEVLRDTNEALRLDPKCAQAHLAIGMGLAGQGDLKGGVAALDKAIELDPALAHAYLCRARAYLEEQLDDPARSLQDMNRYLELKPHYSFSSPELPYWCRARALQKLHRNTEALANYLMAWKINPSPDLAQELWLAYVVLGKNHLALHYAREYIRLAPDSATGHGMVAITLARIGDREAATKSFEKYLALGVADLHFESFAGQIHRELGNYKEALKYFNKALEIDPEDLVTLDDLASLLATCTDAKLRDGPKAVRLASKVYENKRVKERVKWHPAIVLAEAHAECGNFDEAVRLARQALAGIARDDYRHGEIRAKLALFEKKLPYRAKAGPVSAEK
jgi:tetratricopeptide (TPR) repeat protein